MRRRFAVVSVVLSIFGAVTLSCSGTMDLGGAQQQEEFPGAGAANGWSSSNEQQPEAIVYLHEFATELALHGGRIYWTGWGEWHRAVRGCETKSCRASEAAYQLVDITPANPSFDFPVAVTVDEATVFWVRGSDLLYCPISGCSGPPTVFETYGHTPSRIAVDDVAVYWTSIEDAGVFKCPKTGCEGAPQPLALNQACAVQIELDETSVWWQSADLSASGCTDGGGMTGPIRRVAKDGTGLVEVVPRAEHLGGLALNDTHVYWTSGANDSAQTGTVLRCPKSGCKEPERIASPGGFVSSLVLDATSVYWYNWAVDSSSIWTGEVLKCPLAGCNASPTVLATATTGKLPLASAGLNHGLALDSEYVYWPAYWHQDNDLSIYGGIWRVNK